ncbi:MAG: chemotaxis protein CheW, partial [Candidatus Binatia bacterium]
TREILAFEVGGRVFALPVARVIGLLRAVAIEPVPGAPPIIEGLINVRGQIVAVLDVRARFGLPSRPVSTTDHLILASAGSRTVALRVDRVVELMRFDPDRVESIDGVLPGIRDFDAVASLPEGLLMIQDVRALLSEAESAGALDVWTQPTLWDRR